jgi:hypothetical protein
VHTLLEQEAPGLFRRLERLSPAGRRSAIAEGSVAVAQALPELPSSLRRLVELLSTNGELSSGEVASARSLAEAADEEYFLLQDQGDQRLALKRFSEARLLTALTSGFGELSVHDCADAVYELCKATDDPSLAIGAIEAAIARQ